MRAVVLGALLVSSVARADDPTSDRITWRAGGNDRALTAKRAGTALSATGGILIAAAAVTGLVSASTVGPCSGDGTCGQEGVLGTVVAPVLAGVGAGFAVSGVALSSLVGRGALAVLPVPRRDGVAIAVAGRF